MKIFFHEKCQFCDFNWLPWQRPLSDRQMNAGLIKPRSTIKNNILKNTEQVHQ